jgi:hypothetical protein
VIWKTVLTGRQESLHAGGRQDCVISEARAGGRQDCVISEARAGGRQDCDPGGTRGWQARLCDPGGTLGPDAFQAMRVNYFVITILITIK